MDSQVASVAEEMFLPGVSCIHTVSPGARSMLDRNSLWLESSRLPVAKPVTSKGNDMTEICLNPCRFPVGLW